MIKGVLKNIIKKMCQEKPGDWNRYIPVGLFAYRKVPQASIGFSSFKLLYDRTVREPMQVLKKLWAEGRKTLLECQATHEHYYDKRQKLFNLKLTTSLWCHPNRQKYIFAAMEGQKNWTSQQIRWQYQDGWQKSRFGTLTF